MAFLRKATSIAVLASAGVMGTAGAAAADEGAWSHGAGDNAVHQEGLETINALNNVNISPNFGCLANQAHLVLGDVTSTVTGSTDLGHLLQDATLNILANGNTTTNVYDNSCTSNQGSSQAGNNSHRSTGAGDSTSIHKVGNGAGSDNKKNGIGAGGLFGGL